MVAFHLPSRERLIAFVDVEAGGARAAILSVQNNSVRVVSQAYSLIQIEVETAEHSIAAIGDRLDDVCKRALLAAEQKGVRSPITSVYAVVHAPWTTSETVRKRVDFPTETHIKDSHIADLAKQVLGEVKTINTAAVMEASVIRTWLNGYAVTDLNGKSAHSVSASAVISNIDPSAQKNIEAALHRAFPVATIEWRSGARALQSVLGSLYIRDENYLAVDLGVDSTFIVSVRDGMPTGERVVPHGLRSILTKIDATRPAEETLGLIRMLSRDACEGTACEAIQKAMAIAEPELVKFYGETLSSLATDRRLSNTLILFANPGIIDWMKQFFSRLDFTQFTATTQPFIVVPFESSMLGSATESDELLHAPIALGAALVNMEIRS